MARSSVALALAAVALAGCSDLTSSGGTVRNQDFVAEATLNLTLDASPQTRFRLEGINGSIEVVGAAATDTFSIHATRQVWSESVADAQAYLDRLEVAVTGSGNEIVIRTVQPQNTGGRTLVVNYVLAVPMRLAASVANVNGGVSIEQLSGDVSVSVVNGAVQIQDVGGSVSVAVVNGVVTARTALAAGEGIDLQTTNGNLTLDIPRSTSAQFAARLVNGVIAINNLTLQGARSTPTSLTGTLGAGAGRVDLETVNGNILVRGF